MRNHAARALSEGILVSLSVGEVIMEADDDAGIVKSVRKQLSAKPGLKDGIDNALMYVSHRFSADGQHALWGSGR
jgi:hypothetical protein